MKLKKKQYLGGLVVTVSSHRKPKQVREVFTVKRTNQTSTR